ncbi:MAG TPA: YHS domain-containing (seleno)protein [Phenylobacterium sp.]|nr:YHS domain-containing (seleno)protein [Phenylobacterium sp.]
MNKKTAKLKSVAAAMLLAWPAVIAASPALAAQPEIYTPPFTSLALQGYDPVSYFSGHPAVGQPRYTAVRKGVQYRFVSAENLARFQANPEAYLPQYGGYCAWAIADGHVAKGDPTIWKIVGGKLYLNYDARVQQRWAADIPGNIAKANSHWPQVLK